jgi:hypothetical protein
LTTVKLVAFIPLNFTLVAVVKLVPVIVTTEPVEAQAGEKELMIGIAVVRALETVQIPFIIIMNIRNR